MDKPLFYEGQQVGCLMYGEGVVVKVDSVDVVACFTRNHVYNLKGVRYNGGMNLHIRPTLYPIEQYREIIANLPAPEPEAWQPKPGEWCWFWDNSCEGKQAVLSQFHSVEDGLFKATFFPWQHCAPFVGELPEHLKEVQP